MKKTILLVAISVLISLTTISQNDDTKRADKHFKRLEFVEAAKDYERLVEAGKANGYVYRQLAESYYNIFETVKAEQNYRRALKTYNEPELVFKYAQMLKANGKYEASNMQMAKFAEMKPNDERAIAFNKNPKYLPKLLERTEKFSITNLPFNSEYSDFGGTLQGGKLYITSAQTRLERPTAGTNNLFWISTSLSKIPTEAIKTQYQSKTKSTPSITRAWFLFRQMGKQFIFLGKVSLRNPLRKMKRRT